MKNVFTAVYLLACFNLYAQQEDFEFFKPLEGLYEDKSGQKYFFNPRDGFPHFTIMQSGETHMLRKKDNVIEFSLTRNNWDEIGGTIVFNDQNKKEAVCIKFNSKKQICAQPISYHKDELSLDLSSELFISGSLYRPSNNQNNIVAVLLHGDGDNDRYDLFDVGMYLLSEGYLVFAFDKRNVGKSKGPVVGGNNYDAISRVYAQDAVDIISKLKEIYPEKRFGVIGMSQGGWIGSIVSSQLPDLAFYVNIAGNVSVGTVQWKHYMISYLKRNKFTPEDVKEAEDYFTSFFNAGLNNQSFGQYESKLSQYKERPWFRELEKRKLVKWKDQNEAVKVIAENSNDPSLDVKKVNCPALGVFFEFDHSTPADSPLIFLSGLSVSKSKDYSVRVFPNSTHGGWTVSSYYFDSRQIKRIESKAFYFIVNWLKTL